MSPQTTGAQRLPSQPAAYPVRQWVSVLLRDEAGQDLIEYGLIAGLIGLAAIASARGLSSNLAAAFSKFGSVMVSAS